MSNETKKYLNDLAIRAQSYFDIAEYTVDYAREYHDIEDEEIITNCVVMGCLWLAGSRQETLTVNDMFILLGTDNVVPIDENNELSLSAHLEDLQLDDIIDATIDYMLD